MMTAMSCEPSMQLWTEGLREEVLQSLKENKPQVMTEMMRRFESVVYKAALEATNGKKIEAAQKLGVGRNTLTRKIQELDLA
jgi:two-component system nitrogen regulation response regulator GlnG